MAIRRSSASSGTPSMLEGELFMSMSSLWCAVTSLESSISVRVMELAASCREKAMRKRRNFRELCFGPDLFCFELDENMVV
jgi:hypothetical protein